MSLRETYYLFRRYLRVSRYNKFSMEATIRYAVECGYDARFAAIVRSTLLSETRGSIT